MASERPNEFEKYLNGVIRKQGCDARLSRRERRAIYARVSESLAGQSSGHGLGWPVLSLIVSQAVDDLTGGDVSRTSRRKSLPRADADAVDSLESLAEDPLEAAQESERAAAIEGEFRMMSPRDREAIGHLYHHGDMRAVQSILGCSRSAAYKWAYEIAIRLGRRLRGHA